MSRFHIQAAAHPFSCGSIAVCGTVRACDHARPAPAEVDSTLQFAVVAYTYHPRILDELGQFGLRPTPCTSPALAKEFVNDLYRHELRALSARLKSREIPKDGYTDRVVALRQKYFLLSIRLELWTTKPDRATQS